jgi:hypothetical protein
LLIIVAHRNIAKSHPTKYIPKLLAFKQAKSLYSGISITCFEKIKNKDVWNQSTLNNTDFMLLILPDFKRIAIPAASEYFEPERIPFEKMHARIDNILKQFN